QPRKHHQWYPDFLRLESGFSPDTIRLLKERGHNVKSAQRSMGSVQTVAYKDGTFRGAADPRNPNSGAAAPAEINANSD
ncbi:MAG: gamma-glutamyltransferase, partial [Proteobacteria bacterium]|nr:gamma-glutamyltransferase [Pseudomonadota bacterium]